MCPMTDRVGSGAFWGLLPANSQSSVVQAQVDVSHQVPGILALGDAVHDAAFTARELLATFLADFRMAASVP